MGTKVMIFSQIFKNLRKNMYLCAHVFTQYTGFVIAGPANC